MKKQVFILAALLIAAVACAPKASKEAEVLTPSKVLLLYPQGQGVDAGIVENGVAVTKGPLEDNELRGPETYGPNGNIGNVGDSASISLYFPKKPNGVMIVNCAGGGYSIVSSINEGFCTAEWLVSQGVTVCDVKYRLPNHHYRVPLQDMQNAFRYCRAHATEWGIDKIGVMGYSAGGHLAATTSNLFVDDATRPDFSVLIYPVITMDTSFTHMGTHDELLGDRTDLEAEYSMEKRVSAKTPVTFIALSADDGTVPPENSFSYFDALATNEVDRQMHVYPSGGHGWGFNHEPYAPERLQEYRPVFLNDLARFIQDQVVVKQQK